MVKKRRNEKMKKHMQGFALNTNTLILGIVGLLALAYFGFISVPGAVGGAGSGGINVLPSTQNLYVNPVNTATPATAVSANSNVYDGSGALLKSQLASGTAQAVPANTKLRVFTNATGYFNSEDFVDSGQQSTIAVSPTMADDTTASVTIFNPGSYTENADGAQAAFAANDQKTFEVDVTGATNKYITNPKVNKIVFAIAFTTPSAWSYSSTSDSYVQDANGNTCAVVTSPVSDASRQIAWECPINNGGTGTAPSKYYLTLKASASGGAAANSTLAVFGEDIYQNTYTGATGIGVENNAGTLLHTYTNATIHTS